MIGLSASPAVHPRVWIGCLACYNSGYLTGDWYDADTGDLVTPEDLHGGPTDHEELWVMDHDEFQGALEGECSPAHAAEIAEALQGLTHDELGPFSVWVAEWGDDVDNAHWVDRFREEYRGFHESEGHYAQEWADDTSQDEDTERMTRWPWNSIDWDRAAEELFSGGLHAEPVSGGGVYVFNPR
ncbi:antirestriction protein ArdA [Streptomyces sp. NPDC056773]|uniref:antirestriction protein ArdA n=1 Tax=unclassified Streptomyces TaxID=2593676 RepID=UPI0036B91EA0